MQSKRCAALNSYLGLICQYIFNIWICDYI